MTARAHALLGRRIVAADMRPARDRLGHVFHDPVLTLDDGSRLMFVVEETADATDYGVRILRVRGRGQRQ